ncbi:MAG: fumarylacetoacetate hydrolase family protein [Ginsengibacter sp.]
MKIYRTKRGIIIESAQKFYAINEDWDLFINNDHLIEKVTRHIASSQAINNGEDILSKELLPPVAGQELWACGVTYLRSKEGRQEESKGAGGGDFYARVYEAERPEVFFKATSHRIVGHHSQVRIRKDSSWDVPEPELTLMVTSSGKIIGYTIGNDMSSRSIEGENPLYLPQAKTYDGCASVGPCIYLTDKPIDKNTAIKLDIKRNEETVFNGQVLLSQMKRSPEELVSFVYRECTFPQGCLIMTGTGIVPGNEFTLKIGDEIQINIDPIGTLVNQVA